jgi:hypothetical protein
VSDDRGPHEEDEPAPADVSIRASARARRLRFTEKADVRTSSTGGAGTTRSSSRRENLPDEIEEGRIYREVRVAWELASSVSVEDDPEGLLSERRAPADGEDG